LMGFKSLGDYVTFKFLSPSRHDRLRRGPRKRAVFALLLNPPNPT
jgi:hypothetical protein